MMDLFSLIYLSERALKLPGSSGTIVGCHNVSYTTNVSQMWLRKAKGKNRVMKFQSFLEKNLSGYSGLFQSRSVE